MAEYNKNRLSVDFGTVISIPYSVSSQLGALEKSLYLSSSQGIVLMRSNDADYNIRWLCEHRSRSLWRQKSLLKNVLLIIHLDQ